MAKPWWVDKTRRSASSVKAVVTILHLDDQALRDAVRATEIAAGTWNQEMAHLALAYLSGQWLRAVIPDHVDERVRAMVKLTTEQLADAIRMTKVHTVESFADKSRARRA